MCVSEDRHHELDAVVKVMDDVVVLVFRVDAECRKALAVLAEEHPVNCVCRSSLAGMVRTHDTRNVIQEVNRKPGHSFEVLDD